MYVPDAQAAVVEQSKIVEYLLNPAHPDGAPKSRFFRRLGFALENWEVLAAELKAIVIREPYFAAVESTFGWKYIVDGTLEGPVGPRVQIRTVWICEHDNPVPRLVTAYPHPGRTNDDPKGA